MYLGSDSFVEAMLGRLDEDKCLSEIPSAQRRPVAQPVSSYEELSVDRN